MAEALSGLESTGVAGEVVVADNGSTDRSVDVAQNAGARVVEISRRGYGACLDGGIKRAKGSIIVMGDADMSYPFSELPSLVRPILEGTADFVLGSRLNSRIQAGAMPTLNRRVGTPLLSALIRGLYKLPISDCNSGMRAFKQEDYISFGLKSPGMEFASEMLIQLAATSLRYLEVSIGFRKDCRGRPPHLKRWRDGWRHLRFIVGSAPSSFVVAAPASIAAAGILTALILSVIPTGRGEVHFHSAFASLSLAMPFSLFALSAFLIKAVKDQNSDSSYLVSRYKRFNDTAGPFYLIAATYFIGFIELVRITLIWIGADFGPIFEIPAMIRMTAMFFIGTLTYALDMGFTLVRSSSIKTDSD